MYWKYVRFLTASLLIVGMVFVGGCDSDSTIFRAAGINVPAAEYLDGSFAFKFLATGAWTLTTKIEGIACGTKGNPDKEMDSVSPAFSGRIEGLRFVATASGLSDDGQREYKAFFDAGFNPFSGNIDGSITVVIDGKGSSCDGSFFREFTLVQIIPPPDTTDTDDGPFARLQRDDLSRTKGDLSGPALRFAPADASSYGRFERALYEPASMAPSQLDLGRFGIVDSRGLSRSWRFPSSDTDLQGHPGMDVSSNDLRWADSPNGLYVYVSWRLGGYDQRTASSVGVLSGGIRCVMGSA